MAGDYLFYEFMELQKKAIETILNGCYKYTDYFQKDDCIINLVVYNYDYAYINWQVFYLKHKYYVCRLKWYFESDWEKFSNPIERMKYLSQVAPLITYSCNIIDNEPLLIFLMSLDSKSIYLKDKIEISVDIVQEFELCTKDIKENDINNSYNVIESDYIKEIVKFFLEKY